MRRVALIGFMGAGKTTVGRALARRLRWTFCDLDDLIERREDQSIAQIFASQGEAGFRRIEAATLRDLLRDDLLHADLPRTGLSHAGRSQADLPQAGLPQAGLPQGELLQERPAAGDLVLALGGGAFVQAENRAALEQAGAITVLLEAPVEELRRRCQTENKARPLAGQEARFVELFAARRADYERARLRVQTLNKAVEQVAAEIEQIVKAAIKAEVEK